MTLFEKNFPRNRVARRGGGTKNFQGRGIRLQTWRGQHSKFWKLHSSFMKLCVILPIKADSTFEFVWRLSLNKNNRCLTDIQREEMLHEFRVLRDEMLLQMKTRYHILGLSVVIFSTFITISLKLNSGILLYFYPLIALFLALGWASADVFVGRIGKYIHDMMETEQTNLRWEHWLQKNHPKPNRFKIKEAFAIGVLVGTQLYAQIFGIYFETTFGASSFTLTLHTAIISINLLFMSASLYWIKARSRLFKNGEPTGGPL